MLAFAGLPERYKRIEHKLSLLLIFLSIGTTSLLSGCSGRGTQVITPSRVTVTAGGTVQFTATVNGAPIPNAIWEVNGVVGEHRPSGRSLKMGLTRLRLSRPEQYLMSLSLKGSAFCTLTSPSSTLRTLLPAS